MEIALVYPVAGMSSRFGGKIKQLAQVTDNKTLIEYSLDQAIPAGFTKIIFIVGEKTEKLFKEKFGDSYKRIPINYCKQTFNPEEREKPWGTTDALCCAKEFLDCPCVFCNGDDIYGKNTFEILVNHIKNNATCATIGYELEKVIPEKGSVNRGIFEIENGFVKSLKEVFNIEKDKLSEQNLSEKDLCSMNIFALTPESIIFLDEIVQDFKKKNKDNPKIECLLPNELSKLMNQNKISMKIYKTPDKWFGVTNPQDEEIIRNELNK